MPGECSQKQCRQKVAKTLLLSSIRKHAKGFNYKYITISKARTRTLTHTQADRHTHTHTPARKLRVEK